MATDQAQRTREFQVGDSLYVVYESLGRPRLCQATITKVAAQTVWIEAAEGHSGGFGFRSRLDRLNAERLAATAEAALSAYVDRCCDQMMAAEEAYKAALTLQESSR